MEVLLSCPRSCGAPLVLLALFGHGALAADDGGSALVRVRLEHVRDGYADAVADGVVVDAEEYGELREMLDDVRATARRLPLASPTRVALGNVNAAVARRAPAEEVEVEIGDVLERLDADLWMDKLAPDPTLLAEGPRLYAAHCAACHGAKGTGPPVPVPAMHPAPIAFADPAISARLSPRRVFDTVTFGIPDTAMAARADVLTPAERWALGFYVVQLGVPPDVSALPSRALPSRALPSGRLPYRTLDDLADTSNGALALLAPADVPAQAAVAWWRGQGTAVAAASRWRRLRAQTRVALALGGGHAYTAIGAQWEAARASVAPGPSVATDGVDRALEQLQDAAADAPAAVNAAARALVDALSALERSGN